MTVEEAIALLERENPKAELYVLRLKRMGNPHYNAWSYIHEEWRRLVGIEARDGRVALIQEDEAKLALAER